MFMVNRGVRYLRVGVILFVLTIAYIHLLFPSHRTYWTSFREPTGSNEDLNSATTLLDYPDQHPFSLSRRPDLGYKHVEYLDKALVPSKSVESEGRQLVIIGDVHGAYAELGALKTKIEKLHPAKSRHYVFVGDMVTIGPQSLEVIDWARAMNASCVMGSQEDRLLRMYNQRQRNLDSPNTKILGDNDLEGLKVNNKFLPSAKRRNSELAMLMYPQHAEFLETCSLILRADNVAGIGDLAVVHAGVIAGVPLEDMDPIALMNMKSMDPVTKLPSEENNGIHWSSYWNQYVHKSSSKKGSKPLTIVYGHNAARNLEIQQYTKGLDSNCIRGGRLSALVINGGRAPNNTVVSVPCNDYIIQ